jgi:hypothetical protein
MLALRNNTMLSLDECSRCSTTVTWERVRGLSVTRNRCMGSPTSQRQFSGPQPRILVTCGCLIPAQGVSSSRRWVVGVDRQYCTSQAAGAWLPSRRPSAGARMSTPV